MSLPAGSRVGPYEVVAPLGAGGMGEVYRARDTKLDRDVAIKILPEAVAADSERLARFEREAKTLAALNHPHIAHVYGFEQTAGTNALVMELVEGEDLALRIARGAIPIDEALPIARQITEALEAAHEHGIVHRDLKPANVKLRPDGSIKVLDFGLAKGVPAVARDFSPASHAALSPTITSPALLTMGGVILGTAAYMAPEQAKGRAVDRRADIWAFGCVLYEMLAGRAPFDGEDVTEILGAIVKTEPDWTPLPATTPVAVRTLIKRCLTKDINRRLQHIGDARIEIVDAMSLTDAPAPPTARPANARIAWAVAALAAIAAALGWTMPLLRQTVPPAEMRLDIATPPTFEPSSFAISPDGQNLAFVGLGGRAETLWIRNLRSATARALSGTENATLPFWSPDSRSLGFFAQGKLKRLDLESGGIRILADAQNARGGTWNQHGVILFVPVPSADGIMRVSASGGDAIRLVELGANRYVRYPVFLPDGDRFLYLIANDADPEGAIVLGSLSNPATATRVLASDSGAVFLPPGHLLFGDDETLYAQPFDPVRGEVGGERVGVETPVVAASAYQVASATATGLFAYRRGSRLINARLTWFDRAGRTLGIIGSPDDSDGGRGTELEFSPDGRSLALIRLASGSTTSGNTDVWLIDLRRGVGTRFTTGEGQEIWPTFNADSAGITYQAGRTIAMKGLNGAESTLLRGENILRPSAWSRDGKFLLYRQEGRDGRGDLWVLPSAESGKPFPAVRSTFDETRAQFSPDGKWISYESDDTGRPEVYVQPFNRPGARVQVSAGGGTQGRWHPSGRELYFLSPDARLMAVEVVPSADGTTLEATAPKPLFATRIYRGGMQQPNFKFQYAVAPDGERFLVNHLSESDVPTPITVVLNWRR